MVTRGRTVLSVAVAVVGVGAGAASLGFGASAAAPAYCTSSIEIVRRSPVTRTIVTCLLGTSSAMVPRKRPPFFSRTTSGAEVALAPAAGGGVWAPAFREARQNKRAIEENAATERMTRDATMLARRSSTVVRLTLPSALARRRHA